MKALVIIEVDPDRVIDENYLASEFSGTIEDAINLDLSHAMSMGQIAIEDINMILLPDSTPPNDSDLGSLIRNKLNQ